MKKGWPFKKGSLSTGSWIVEWTVGDESRGPPSFRIGNGVKGSIWKAILVTTDGFFSNRLPFRDIKESNVQVRKPEAGSIPQIREISRNFLANCSDDDGRSNWRKKVAHPQPRRRPPSRARGSYSLVKRGRGTRRKEPDSSPLRKPFIVFEVCYGEP